VGHENAAELADRAVAQSLSVREVEKLARKPSTERAPPRRAREPRDPETNADLEALQRDLEEFLGLPVKIASDSDPRTGSVTVRYRTLDQLDLVCQRLTGRSI
jgi:ParB family chromosome partitioning protein